MTNEHYLSTRGAWGDWTEADVVEGRVRTGTDHGAADVLEAYVRSARSLPAHTRPAGWRLSDNDGGPTRYVDVRTEQ